MNLAVIRTYLSVLAGAAPERRLIDIRHRVPSGMRKQGVPAAQLERAAATIHGHARRADTYVGVLLRDGRAGGKEYVNRSHLVWIEIDAPDSAQRLAAAPHPPTMVVTSGTPGHLHVYWTLTEHVGTAAVESANCRLAHLLGGDPACTDSARLLRPAGTLNYKHTPPAAVQLVVYRPELVYPLDALVDGLHDPADDQPERAPVTVRSLDAYREAAAAGQDIYRYLRAISTAEYVSVLVGRTPDREHKICCPFHDERTPSFHCYADGTWYCYGCRAGGSVFDFASRLWGLPTRPRLHHPPRSPRGPPRRRVPAATRPPLTAHPRVLRSPSPPPAPPPPASGPRAAQPPARPFQACP